MGNEKKIIRVLKNFGIQIIVMVIVASTILLFGLHLAFNGGVFTTIPGAVSVFYDGDDLRAYYWDLRKQSTSALEIGEEVGKRTAALHRGDIIPGPPRLKEFVSEDPEHDALAIFIRMELEFMESKIESKYDASISVLSQQIEYFSSLSKWLVGVLLAMAVSILGLAIGSIVQKRSGSR